jgi:hypothetical protein
VVIIATVAVAVRWAQICWRSILSGWSMTIGVAVSSGVVGAFSGQAVCAPGETDVEARSVPSKAA